MATVPDDKLGPLHAYNKVPVPPAPFAVRFTVPPKQIGVLLAGAAVGTAFTVTVVVYTVPELQPLPVLLTVNE